MTLKTLMASDVTDVFHNTDEFAESFVYRPKLGAERSITAAVALERPGYEQTPHGKREIHRLQVLVKNDATTGIEAPRPGETLERTAEAQPRIKFMLKDVIASDDAAMLIEFIRPKQTRSGQNASYI